MAEGMCIFLERTINNLKDLNEYCYYVAGTVGIYLTNILRIKGINITSSVFKRLEENAVPFGLFLQKLNIIRDYIEDRDLKERSFWPQEYFINEKDNIKILDKMCDETLENDVRHLLGSRNRRNPAGDFIQRGDLGQFAQVFLKLFGVADRHRGLRSEDTQNPKVPVGKWVTTRFIGEINHPHNPIGRF